MLALCLGRHEAPTAEELAIIAKATKGSDIANQPYWLI